MCDPNKNSPAAGGSLSRAGACQGAPGTSVSCAQTDVLREGPPPAGPACLGSISCLPPRGVHGREAPRGGEGRERERRARLGVVGVLILHRTEVSLSKLLR